MREAALLSLSSHSVLLSIREECTPSSIPHYTPSVTVRVCVSACVCPQFDWSSTLQGKWWPVRAEEPVTSLLSVSRVFIMTEHSRHCRLMIERSWSLCVCMHKCVCVYAYRVYEHVLEWQNTHLLFACVCKHECVRWCIEQSFLRPLSQHWLFCGACQLLIATISRSHAPPPLGLSGFSPHSHSSFTPPSPSFLIPSLIPPDL